MNICVIDDNIITAKCVCKMVVDSCTNLNLSMPNVNFFTSPSDFLKWFDYNSVVDACFLDIDLKHEVNGLILAKRIKEINYHTLLIFMTSYDTYFTEMVQVEPFRFLSKPFQYQDFHRIFVDVYKRIILKQSENDCIYKFKNNGIIFSTNLKDVIYVSSYMRKIIMMDIRNQHMEFYGKLDQVERDIKSLTDKFVRINKSYLFNKDYIENIGKNTITVKNVTYHISPKYKQNLEIIT